MSISSEYFEQMVGRPPEQDDLERVNCKEEGATGHSDCGWCDCLKRPVFEGRCSKSISGGVCMGEPIRTLSA